ncbi:major facilitator superfamily domain-containing protein, partial [Xylogone sp. PMI_703]
LIVLTLSILSMTTALDAGILVTSLPTIATAEHSSESSGFWIGTSYLLVAAVLMPFIGALSDVLGRRPVFATTVMSLLIGSIVAGSAQSTAQIIVGRVLQGIGSAGVQPLTYVLLTDLVPLRQRPKYLAFVHLSFAVGLAIAALIGGALSQYSTWRWVFYINLPFCAIGLVMIFFFVNLEHKNHASLFQKLRTQVDWIGSFIFTTSITLALVALTWGGINFSWASAATIVPLILGILGLGATWVWEKRYATNPFIRLAIFKEWSAIAGYIATVIFGFVIYAQNYFIPYFGMAVKGYSPTRMGVIVLPYAVSIMPISIPVNIIIARTGRVRWALWIGWILQLIFSGLLLLFNRSRSDATISGILFLGGALQGFLFPSLAFVPQAMAKNTDEGYAATMFIFFRALGMTLGLALGGTVFQNTLKTHLIAEGIDNGLAKQISSNALLFVTTLRQSSDTGVIDKILTAITDSFYDVCYVNLALVAIGLVVSFTVKRPDLNHSLASNHTVKG